MSQNNRGHKVFFVVVNWERVHIFHWLSVACMAQNKIKNDFFVLMRRREEVHFLLVCEDTSGNSVENTQVVRKPFRGCCYSPGRDAHLRQ